MLGNVISLKKGEVINLSKIPAIDLSKGGRGLKKVIVGLGWDPITSTESGKKRGLLSSLFGGGAVLTGSNIDCDAFAALCDKNNKIYGEDDIIWYGNLQNRDKSVLHTGDNLTGDGDGDDEQIIVDLAKLRKNVDKVVIGVNIYKGRERRQHFGLLQNAFIRIVDAETDTELCRYDLNENYNNEVSLFFGELIRQGNEWTFSASGIPAGGGYIAEILKPYMV